ncbi:DUF4236 domain-containing protein [Catalinimonas sp. 4WD22]|uniref:DUF4236 domain-containing protein n=1 Tax=Catalinimonas locisalis TaxID=3133978 RepID=UPI003101508F
MGFRFQQRKKITDWLRLNFSRSGISPSIRTKIGSFNPNGFSLLTGIPGLTYRKGRGKGNNQIGLILLIIGGLILIVANVCRLLWYLVALLVGFIRHLIR